MDLSAEMAAYGLQKSEKVGVQLRYDCADMIHYQSSQKYDVASILMDSTSYLLTNEQVIAHFQTVAKILNPGGIYILEISHPRSVFQIAQSTVNDWKMSREGISVKIQWGFPEDQFNPISQVTEVSVRLEYQDGDKQGVIESKAPQRCFTATELDALVRAAGCFELVDWFGAMDAEVPFTNDEKSWRMIPVLKLTK